MDVGWISIIAGTCSILLGVAYWEFAIMRIRSKETDHIVNEWAARGAIETRRTLLFLGAALVAAGSGALIWSRLGP